MSKTTTRTGGSPRASAEPGVRIQIPGKSAAEFEHVIYDLSRETDEADRQALAALLENRMLWHRTRGLTVTLPLTAETEPVLRTLIGELWHWGDPGGGWLECFLFRCRPFRRAAKEIAQALTAWDGRATWAESCGRVERSDDPAYVPLQHTLDHWTRLA